MPAKRKRIRPLKIRSFWSDVVVTAVICLFVGIMLGLWVCSHG